MVCHHGKSVGGGHYTNYTRDAQLSTPQQEQWFRYDDAKVSLCSSEEALAQGREAYLLFYERRF